MTSETAALVTFVIAMLGLVLSILGLAWQFWTWRSSGARVRAKFVPGFTVPPFGPSTRLYSLELTNRGRGPTQVTQYGFQTGRGAIMIQNAPENFPHVPMTLEGYHEQSFVWTAEAIDEALAEDPHGVLRPYARLGNGGWVYAPERLGRTEGDGDPEIVTASRWNAWWRRRGRGLTKL